jgi:hypothetical protein
MPGKQRLQKQIKKMYKSGCQWLTPVILAAWEAEIRGSGPAQTNSSQDLISKRNRAKWTGGVAQAVERLLCKCTALSSNPSPTKKKKKII